jgi:hypothetical protein
MNEWMYTGWAFLALAPRPTVIYCAPIILEENYKLWRSSLCSFLEPPVTSSLLAPPVYVPYCTNFVWKLVENISWRFLRRIFAVEGAEIRDWENLYISNNTIFAVLVHSSGSWWCGCGRHGEMTPVYHLFYWSIWKKRAFNNSGKKFYVKTDVTWIDYIGVEWIHLAGLE